MLPLAEEPKCSRRLMKNGAGRSEIVSSTPYAPSQEHMLTNSAQRLLKVTEEL